MNYKGLVTTAAEQGDGTSVVTIVYDAARDEKSKTPIIIASELVITVGPQHAKNLEPGRNVDVSITLGAMA